MKREFKVSLVAIGAALLFSLMALPSFGGGYEVFFITLGIICLLESLALLFFGLILFATSKRVWGKPFLLAAAICLVVGTGVCGTLFIATA